MNHHGKRTALLQLYACVLALAILAGCAGGLSQGGASKTFVPITDLSMVSGNWEGMLKKDHSVIPGEMVNLMIHANGTYTFIGQRVSDVALGSGFLEIRDGRVSGDTDRRIAHFALYDQQGKVILVVECSDRQTGERYYGEVKRAIFPK